jgi:hypothetical protein
MSAINKEFTVEEEQVFRNLVHFIQSADLVGNRRLNC